MDGRGETFEDVVDQIVAGARKLMEVCEDREVSYQDPEEPFMKISAGAFCLKMSHRIWSDIKQQQMAPAMMGMIGVGAGPLAPGRPMGSVRKRKAVEGQPLEDLLSELSSDEAEELAKFLQQKVEGKSSDPFSKLIDDEPV